jgi:hypothetical protein
MSAVTVPDVVHSEHFRVVTHVWWTEAGVDATALFAGITETHDNGGRSGEFPARGGPKF